MQTTALLPQHLSSSWSTDSCTIRVYIYIHVYIYMYIYIHIYIYECVCLLVLVAVCVRVRVDYICHSKKINRISVDTACSSSPTNQPQPILRIIVIAK